MRHFTVFAFTILVSALALPVSAQTAGAASGSPTNYADAKALADKDEASLPADIAKAMRITQSDTVDQGIKTCASPEADTRPFVIVAGLDADGTIKHTWRQGETPLAVCMEKFLRGRTLMRPTRVPFYVSYELSFEK